MKRKPGKTIPELASRIRQDAATCDFQSIKDPLNWQAEYDKMLLHVIFNPLKIL